MDRVKRYLFKSQPVRRQNFSQDITPGDRRHRIVESKVQHLQERIRYGAEMISKGQLAGKK